MYLKKYKKFYSVYLNKSIKNNNLSDLYEEQEIEDFDNNNNNNVKTQEKIRKNTGKTQEKITVN